MLNHTIREKFLFLLFVLVLSFAILRSFSSRIVMFVYNHPEVNTGVYSYIAPTIKQLDSILDKTKEYMGNDNYKISFVYRNYYGSGFLKYNSIPNDLDASVGVYLGKYEYDGKNSDDILNSVMSKMSVFYTAFSEAVNNYSSNKLFAELSPFDTLSQDRYSESDKIAFKVALSKVFSDSKPYIFMTPKSPIDDNSIKVNVPYYLQSNEILIEDKKPFVLYSNLISYNPDMKKYLREFTVIFDFFIDVQDKETSKIRRLELIPEAFLGERLQYSRRMFVPNVFTGLESYKYLMTNKYLANDELYLANRLYNFERYIQLFEYNLDKSLLHVKMLKRLHQALDAFYPLLSEQELADYYTVVNNYLNDESVKNLNEITNISILLSRISKSSKIYHLYKQTNQISLISDYFDEAVESLKQTNKFDITLLNKLLVVKNSIVAKMLAVRTEKDYEDMVEFVASTKSEIFDITGELYPCVIDKNKLFVIDNALKQKFLDAGYTRIKVYWLDENNIAVLNNPLLENISEEDFRKYAVESGLPDVKYSYFDKKDFKGKIFVDSLVWIRLNPNSAQDAYFEKLKMLLISDKKNYSIKTRFILK